MHEHMRDGSIRKKHPGRRPPPRTVVKRSATTTVDTYSVAGGRHHISHGHATLLTLLFAVRSDVQAKAKVLTTPFLRGSMP